MVVYQQLSWGNRWPLGSRHSLGTCGLVSPQWCASGTTSGKGRQGGMHDVHDGGVPIIIMLPVKP
jgi:hypothetical protein